MDEPTARCDHPSMSTPPLLTAADVDDYRSSLSNWARWGDDDERGCVNHLRPEHTAAAAALVRTAAPSRAHAAAHRASPENPRPVEHHMIGTATEGYGADWFGIAPHGHATSHLDALCHIFWDGQLYGGRSRRRRDRARRHRARGPHAPRRHGRSRRSPRRPCRARRRRARAGTAITVDDLEACEARADSASAPATCCSCAPAGGAGVTSTVRGRSTSGSPGCTRRACRGCTSARSRCWAATGCPTSTPRTSRACGLPIHTVGIVAMGLHLLDNLDLEALAAACAEEQRAEFLLTVAPLILRGGTASPVNPIATF